MRLTLANYAAVSGSNQDRCWQPNQDEGSVNKNEQQLIKLGTQLDKQRRLLKRIQCVYEAERREWARLLHDDFGQSLAAIKSFAVGIRNTTDETSDEHELAENIQAIADELYLSAYDLMRGLRSGFIDDIGLLGGIQVCIENSRLAQQGIKVQIQSEGEIESLGLLMNVAILRMVQESLSGIIRSSSPSNIVIFISVQPRRLDERRKHPRNTGTDETGSALPVREVLQLKISSNAVDTAEYDNYMGVFQRTKDYVEAFGGAYSFKQVDNDGIGIQISLDITDLIEDAVE